MESFVIFLVRNTAVMNCRSLMEKAPQLGIRVLGLLKRAHCDVTAVDIAVSLEGSVR